MNEKYQQYINVRNDKTLIERCIPTERDLLIFEDWKIMKREQLKKSAFGMLVVLLFIIIVRNSLEKYNWNIINCTFRSFRIFDNERILKF